MNIQKRQIKVYKKPSLVLAPISIVVIMHYLFVPAVLADKDFGIHESNGSSVLDARLLAIIEGKRSLDNANDLMEKDLPKIKSLNARQKGITSIEGISLLDTLQTLDLSWNQISALPRRFRLNSLKEMDLTGNNLAAIDGDIVVPRLEKGYFGHNQIKDVQGLSELEVIEDLDLSNNDIENIKPLSPLKTLKRLDLSNNRIQSIDALSSLNELQTLMISGNNIQDLSPLLSLQELRLVYVQGNPISKKSREIIIPQLGERGVVIKRTPVQHNPIINLGDYRSLCVILVGIIVVACLGLLVHSIICRSRARFSI